jgi:hypothetical protein
MMDTSSICLYYGFDGPPPIEEPALILNGENRISSSIQSENIIINNICFPSSVSSSYAPENKSLASVTVVNCPQDIDEATLRARVSAELLSWWGPAVNDWNFLRMYRIPYAQPAQRIPYAIKGKNEVVSDGIQCCGDHRGGATLNGAISSGRRAAKRILDML